MEHGSSENTHQTRAFEKGLNFIYSDFQQTYNTNDLSSDRPQTCFIKSRGQWEAM